MHQYIFGSNILIGRLTSNKNIHYWWSFFESQDRKITHTIYRSIMIFEHFCDNFYIRFSLNTYTLYCCNILFKARGGTHPITQIINRLSVIGFKWQLLWVILIGNYLSWEDRSMHKIKELGLRGPDSIKDVLGHHSFLHFKNTLLSRIIET